MHIHSARKHTATRKAAVLTLSFLLAACGGGSSDPVGSVSKASTSTKLAATTTAVPVATPATYTVANVASNAYIPYWDNRSLNDKGQVIGQTYFTGPNAFHAFRYEAGTLTDLGSLGGANSYSYATAVSASGLVTGSSDNGQAYNAFRSDGITMTDLGSFGPYGSEATGINDSGQVIGSSHNGFTPHAFLSDGVTMKDLGSLGAAWSYATDINASGQVTGRSHNNTNVHAFRSDGTTMTDLGALGNASFYSEGIAINVSGQVTGFSYNGNTYNAFRSDGTTMIDLGSLGNYGSIGRGINAAGQVVGYSYNGFTDHAFVADGITMTDLGALGGQYDASVGLAINASGQAVGYSYVSGNPRAFIKSPADSQMIDLNTRLTNAPGVEVNYAMAISDSGYILAYANTGYVLLKPSVPTPPPTAATVSPITANDPVAVGTQVNVSVQFSDINTSDLHTAVWAWEGNGTTNGSVTEQNGTTPGTVTGTKTITAAGVYNVTVTLTDNGGKSSQVGRQVVVYDPSAGFVTGGGWIMSPVGAYKADETLAGRATFGFVSKYLKGANKPTGETEFHFHAAKLNFHSSDYEWLVVGGARAQYKGSGTINGTGSYKFLLTAVDGDLIAKGTPDRFRIKIWHHDEATNTDVTDYDNQISSSGEGTSSEGTIIGSGSISIKTK